jgi:lactate dehydrogenase-like 2-hydroxyacid dehydrogenase
VYKQFNYFLICFLRCIAVEIGQEIIVINKIIKETVLVIEDIFNKSAEEINDLGLGVGEGIDGTEEEGVFFQDLSGKVIQDDQLARLLTFPNVLVTSHQGFLTIDALTNIAATTLQNIAEYQAKGALTNEVSL